jgi:hypothetical protein
MPDWSLLGPHRGFMGLQFDFPQDPEAEKNRWSFCSSGMKDAVATFADDLSTLIVRGLVWDTVKDFSSIAGTNSQRTGVDSGVASGVESAMLRGLLEQNAYPSKRYYVQSIWQTCLLDSDTSAIKFRSEHDFQALGLDDASDPITKSLRSRGPHLNLSVFIPKVLDEIARHSMATHDRLFFTATGFIGKDFSEQVRFGDFICILLGCPVPVAVQQVGSHYESIRSVYIDGIMFGEAMAALERGEVELEDFELH